MCIYTNRTLSLCNFHDSVIKKPHFHLADNRVYNRKENLNLPLLIAIINNRCSGLSNLRTLKCLYKFVWNIIQQDYIAAMQCTTQLDNLKWRTLNFKYSHLSM